MKNKIWKKSKVKNVACYNVYTHLTDYATLTSRILNLYNIMVHLFTYNILKDVSCSVKHLH